MSDTDDTPRGPKIAFGLQPETGPKRVSLGMSIPLAVSAPLPPPPPPREFPPLPLNDMVQGFAGEDDVPAATYAETVKDEPAPEGTPQDWKPAPGKQAGEVASRAVPGQPRVTPGFGFLRDIPEKDGD